MLDTRRYDGSIAFNRLTCVPSSSYSPFFAPFSRMSQITLTNCFFLGAINRRTDGCVTNAPSYIGGPSFDMPHGRYNRASCGLPPWTHLFTHPPSFHNGLLRLIYILISSLTRFEPFVISPPVSCHSHPVRFFVVNIL